MQLYDYEDDGTTYTLNPNYFRNLFVDFGSPLSERERAELALEQAQADLDRIIRKEEAIERYGEDVWEIGTTFTFDKQFTNDGKTFTYAAVKSPVGWSFTGYRCHPHTWEQFVEFLAEGVPVAHLWWATQYEDVVA